MDDFVVGLPGSETRPFFAQQPCDPPPQILFEHVPSCLPKTVAKLYRTFGEEYEFYKGEMTILSLKSCMRRCADSKFLDFAMTYAGMGHVCVFFADKQTGVVYKRLDGGSNGFERNENARKHLQYKPSFEDVVDFEEELIAR